MNSEQLTAKPPGDPNKEYQLRPLRLHRRSNVPTCNLQPSTSSELFLEKTINFFLKNPASMPPCSHTKSTTPLPKTFVTFVKSFVNLVVKNDMNVTTIFRQRPIVRCGPRSIVRRPPQLFLEKKFKKQ